MKKRVVITPLLGLLTLIGVVLFFNWQPKGQNIFEEMYKNTVNRVGGTAYHDFQDKVDTEDFRAFDSDMNETRDWNTTVAYKEEVLPKGYLDITLMFFGHENRLSISFSRFIDDDVKMDIGCIYDIKTKILKKRIYIITTKGEGESIIDDTSQVKQYLKKYHISSKDLDGYYNEIVNQKVLRDWTTIYDSKYSPEDYGQVEVETQWADW